MNVRADEEKCMGTKHSLHSYSISPVLNTHVKLNKAYLVFFQTFYSAFKVGDRHHIYSAYSETKLKLKMTVQAHTTLNLLMSSASGTLVLIARKVSDPGIIFQITTPHIDEHS